MRDNLRRMARVHAEFDRIEAEHDAAGGPPGRVPVVGFNHLWTALPASLGMVIAAARGWSGGELEASYDFRPRLLWDRPRLEPVAAGAPGIYLFSNYIWSTTTNLANSALVKQLNPHSVTVHGGPDTPKYVADTERFFADNPHVDIVVHGEGEATFPEMLAALRGAVGDGPPDLSALAAVPGLSFRQGNRVVRVDGRDRIADLDALPSPILTGVYDGFVPAGPVAALVIESNRGCPYGCTFCDWGSATLSRIRQFDLQRFFDELEWCAQSGFRIAIADANFGIFERDVAIAQRIVDLKATYGYPEAVGNNYAKNTVKHLARIIELFTEAGIVAEGKMSMQTFDTETLHTIRRKNIKVEKYHDMSVEFRRNQLPLSVDIMMGLPGATPDAFRTDLQSCIDRDLRTIIHATVLLPNSPMNEESYRHEHGIVARPGEELHECATYTRDDWDEMSRLMWAFWVFENFAVLRQVATYVRAETGEREIDFYSMLVEDAHRDPERWPTISIALRVLPEMMVPPVSWRQFIDEVHRYLVDRVGVRDDDALHTVLAAQHALLPAFDRTFPVTLELPHDYARWHTEVAEQREQGNYADWHVRVRPLRDHPPATFGVDDPFDSCQHFLGESCLALAIQGSSNWDLASPVGRPRQRKVEPEPAPA
jgi:hypothetical protein